jgi:hypothetical protein
MLRRAIFPLLAAFAAFSAEDVVSRADRVIAVGDLHGDYEQTVAVFRSAGLIDEKENWTGGKTHLVQTGDILDRGADGFKIIDLLMKLERQARRAGGRVHALLGNHEAMNLYGDLRYVSPAEMGKFEKPEQRAELLGPHGKYGRWIRNRPAVLKIDRTLFLHGGIGPAYGEFSVREINQRVRDELRDFTKLPGGTVMDTEGPLWFRGLAHGAEAPLVDHLNAVLARHGADRIVVGHTIMPRITSRFGGKVIVIDVALSKAYNANQLSCLLIENGKPFALERGQRREIAAASE